MLDKSHERLAEGHAAIAGWLSMSSSVLSLLPADTIMPTHQDCACDGIIISAGSKESALFDIGNDSEKELYISAGCKAKSCPFVQDAA